MTEPLIIRAATPADVAGIVAVIRANLADASLFQRSAADIAAQLDSYFVAECADRQIAGCAALQRYFDGSAELHSVAVLPQMQGRQIGRRLVEEGMQRAAATGIEQLWLGTLKPAYFARFGFVPMSQWQLPWRILWPKFKGVFTQPPERWLPALLGRYRFMVLSAPPH